MEQVPVIEADEVRFAVAVAARAMLDSSAAQRDLGLHVTPLGEGLSRTLAAL